MKAARQAFFVDAATFVRSGSTLAHLGDATRPEVAFIGRSNVGKSSLLNTMMSTKNLVRTSKTPGQTRLINLFNVHVRGSLEGDRKVLDLTMVDLPGYGYAKASGEDKRKLGAILSTYLGRREGLKAIVHLVDLRHEPSAQDVAMFQETAELDRARIVVATKGDKVPVSKHVLHKKAIAKALGIGADAVVVFSIISEAGREELWRRITRIVVEAEPASEASTVTPVPSNAPDTPGAAAETA